MEFEIRTKEIEINGQHYRIRPLSGRFLPKFYAILEGMQGMDTENMKDGDMFKFLNEKSVENLHKISLETLKKSAPKISEEILDEFVSQNLLSMFQGIMEVNMPKQDEPKQS
jgi:hypothetical protein